MKPITEIDPAKVKVFIDRARDAEGHGAMRRDIKRRGQIMPGKVRDIRHLPDEARRRPDGTLADFELIEGQGRLMNAEKNGEPFRCFVEKIKEVDIPGLFLIENTNREPLPETQRNKLLKAELDAGATVKELSERLSLTPGHVAKLARIAEQVAPELRAEVERMPINTAEQFASLPKRSQLIVMEAFHEAKTGHVEEIVKRAKQMAEKPDVQLSKRGLLQSIERVERERAEVVREQKLKRFHYSLGPEHIFNGLKNKKIRALLKKKGINFARFEEYVERNS